MLWLALSIPELPLLIFDRASAADAPFAVIEERRVHLANHSARAAGVHPGMTLSAAQALVRELVYQPRRHEREAEALRRLADWALQFSPLVSLQPPQGLLIEIGASLRLFGGLAAMLAQVEQALEPLGYRAELAVAPTSGAAWLLNRGGDTEPVSVLEDLPERLAPLPVEVLELAPRASEALLGLAVTNLGELLALPRAGLARRLDPELVTRLDRALGRAPDPRRPHLPRPHYRNELELPAEIEHCEALLFPLRRMFHELAGFLRGLDSAIERLQVRLRHAGDASTELRVGLAAPDRDPERLLSLLREHLERTRLTAPVRALVVEARQLQPFQGRTPSLLGEETAQGNLWTQFVERLYARLGEDALLGLHTVSEHRPERAWRYTAPGTPAAAEPQDERPLWLLPRPQRLACRDGRPQWQGPLVLQQGPERIESGWWDGQDVTRDYYIARCPDGARVWVFQERRGRGWFLHGLFS